MIDNAAIRYQLKVRIFEKTNHCQYEHIYHFKKRQSKIGKDQPWPAHERRVGSQSEVGCISERLRISESLPTIRWPTNCLVGSRLLYEVRFERAQARNAEHGYRHTRLKVFPSATQAVCAIVHSQSQGSCYTSRTTSIQVVCQDNFGLKTQ